MKIKSNNLQKFKSLSSEFSFVNFYVIKLIIIYLSLLYK